MTLGWSKTKSQPEEVKTKITEFSALELINRAKTAAELEILPSIGEASASRIFAARPTDGYGALSDVAEVDGLTRVQWPEVEAWRGGD